MCAGIFQSFRCGGNLLHCRHPGRQHDTFARGGAGLEQIGHQQVIGRDLVEIDERLQFAHRFEIKRRAGKLNSPYRTMFGQGRQMGKRQFPFRPGAMFGAAAQNFRREHAVDLEKLEFDRVAAGIGGGIHKGAGPPQIAAMIARRFSDEEGRNEGGPHQLERGGL